jgi:hypothetical protein
MEKVLDLQEMSTDHELSVVDETLQPHTDGSHISLGC